MLRAVVLVGRGDRDCFGLVSARMALLVSANSTHAMFRGDCHWLNQDILDFLHTYQVPSC